MINDVVSVLCVLMIGWCRAGVDCIIKYYLEFFLSIKCYYIVVVKAVETGSVNFQQRYQECYAFCFWWRIPSIHPIKVRLLYCIINTYRSYEETACCIATGKLLLTTSLANDIKSRFGWVKTLWGKRCKTM